MTGAYERLLYERVSEYNKRRFFGEYRLTGATPQEAFLGGGTYGRVFSVFREEDGPDGKILYPAAIKVIPIDEEVLELQRTLSKEERLERLNNELKYARMEIEIMSRLEGESNIAYFRKSAIIPRNDTELQSWDVLICMDKLVMLRDRLGASSLKPDTNAYLMEVLYIWKDISAALTVCERNSILHMDVKPENVFYAAGPNHYKLSDFGTSMLANQFKQGIRRGTYDYMSPEMYRRKGGDSRTDIYSLAVMIYELFNDNRLPLQVDCSREEAWKARLEDLKTIPKIKSIPNDINEVLLRCLDSDPKRRYARCSDASDAVLELYLKYRNGKLSKQRNNKWIIPVVAGVLAVGAIGMGVMLSGGKKDQNDITVQVSDRNMVEIPVVASLDTENESTLPEESTIEPTVEPTTEPTATPTVEPTIEPTATPTETPTATPKIVRNTEPSVQNVRISVNGETAGDAPIIVDGGSIAFDWDAEGSVESYCLYIDDANGNTVYQLEGTDYTQRLVDIDELTPGETYTVTVGALPEDSNESIVWAEAQFWMPTPEPTPSPTPAPVITLEVDTPVIWQADGTTITGNITSDSEIDPQQLKLYVNDETWAMDIQDQGNGKYRFTAQNAVSDTSQHLLIQVRLGDVESVKIGVSMEIVTPSPTPVPSLSLLLDDTFIVADSNDISISGKVLVDGEIDTSEFLLSVNGSTIDALWNPQEDGIEFTAQLSVILDDLQALEIKVYSAKNNAVLPAVASIEVRQPEIVIEPFEAITLDNLEKLNNCWLTTGEVLVVSGRADPDGAVNVSINNRLIGSYTVEHDGAFSIEILSSAWVSGENAISLDYVQTPDDGDYIAEFSVNFDGDAPEITAEQNINQYTQMLTVTVQDLDPDVSVEMVVDDTMHYEGTLSKTENQQHTFVFSDIDECDLANESKIEIVAKDSAGNTATLPISYKLEVNEIVITNATEISTTKYGVDSVVEIRGTATPGSTLSISCGDATGQIVVKEDGSFTSSANSRIFSKGPNDFIIEYLTVGGKNVDKNTGSVQFSAYYDGIAPEIKLNTEKLINDERELIVLISGEPNGSEVRLMVDGKYVGDSVMDSGNGEYIHLSIPDDIRLSESSIISVVAIDTAGNAASVEVTYKEYVAATILNADKMQSQWWGIDNMPTIKLSGEPKAELMITINDSTTLSWTLNRNGAGLIAINEYLKYGKNKIDVTYADYPIDELSAQTTFYYDGEQPIFTVSPEIIDRDTTEIVVAASNEPGGYIVSLSVDGSVVRESEASGNAEAVLNKIDELSLNKAKSIVLSVWDGVNDPVTYEMSYADTSSKLEGYAFAEKNNFGTVTAGGTVSIDAYVICSDYDMTDGYVSVLLVDESNTGSSCRFNRESLDSKAYDQLVDNAEVTINNTYAQRAYLITDVVVSDYASAGKYTLKVQINAEHESYTYEIGTLVVEKKSMGNAVSEDYINRSAVYAVGFDEPLASTFRSNDVVLTGWTFRTEEQLAYFHQYEVYDALGLCIYKGYFTEEELKTYLRNDVNDHVPELAASVVDENGMVIGCAVDNAGFVMTLDLSGIDDLKNGEQYTLKIYSSNEIGEAWQTINATILIDESAKLIDGDQLTEITESWQYSEGVSDEN